jgi:hypothetical protein
MRRRRRAARGPLGGMGGSFILDVILHLELILCQEQILRLQSAMVLVGSGMSPRPGPDHGGNQPIRTRSSAWASRNEAENTVNELLTHYTSIPLAVRSQRVSPPAPAVHAQKPNWEPAEVEPLDPLLQGGVRKFRVDATVGIHFWH